MSRTRFYRGLLANQEQLANIQSAQYGKLTPTLLRNFYPCNSRIGNAHRSCRWNRFKTTLRHEKTPSQPSVSGLGGRNGRLNSPLGPQIGPYLGGPRTTSGWPKKSTSPKRLRGGAISPKAPRPQTWNIAEQAHRRHGPPQRRSTTRSFVDRFSRPH